MTVGVLDPIADEVRDLCAEDAHQTWRTVLARQGLAGGSKPTSVAEAAERGLGLHAARLPSPYATLLARLSDPAAADALFEPRDDAGLTTVRCMRKTLHVLPTPLAGIAHTATRHFRERDALRGAQNLGITAGQLRRLIAAMLRLLGAGGPLGYRDVEAAMVPEFGSVSAVRAALKVAWERGDLIYRNRAPYWNREVRVFGAAASMSPDFTSDGDRVHAAHHLIREYFERYGPASIRDAVWWSGLSQSSVRSALLSAGRPVVALVVPWSPGTLYMFADSATEERACAESTATVDFLAHEDVALKAYFESRGRYLAGWPQRRIFNQIGEVLPSILADGRLVGAWSWSRRDRRVAWELFAPDKLIGRACKEKADILTAVLRSRYDG